MEPFTIVMSPAQVAAWEAAASRARHLAAPVIGNQTSNQRQQQGQPPMWPAPWEELGPKAPDAVALLALVAGQDVEPVDGSDRDGRAMAHRAVCRTGPRDQRGRPRCLACAQDGVAQAGRLQGASPGHPQPAPPGQPRPDL